jgi:hypothetical protein
VSLERHGSNTKYSINSENYDFHVDNLRDVDYTEDYEKGMMRTKINDILKCINPFLSKCVIDSGNGGPGINYFKFLRREKVKRLTEKGICNMCPSLVQAQEKDTLNSAHPKDGEFKFPERDFDSTCNAEFNCEYHYVSQTSFYWDSILSKVVNNIEDELNSYDWNLHILIVMQLPNTRDISKEKYETYAKIIDKNEIVHTKKDKNGMLSIT